MKLFKKKKNRTPKPHELVTIVNNDTGKKVSGEIISYTPDEIKIITVKKVDAKKWHFEDK